MDIAKLILEYIQGLIYPLLIFTIALIFKRELRLLLSGKLTAQYKDLIITIEKQKQELEVSERQTHQVVQTMQFIKDTTTDTNKLQDPITIKNYLQDAIDLLKLSPNEYSIFEFLQGEPDSGTDKATIINKFLDPHIPFDNYKSGIENALDSLQKKGIIMIDRGHIVFIHKLFKEMPLEKRK